MVRSIEWYRERAAALRARAELLEGCSYLASAQAMREQAVRLESDANWLEARRAEAIGLDRLAQRLRSQGRAP